MIETKVTKGFWRTYQDVINENVIPYQWKALNDELEHTEPSHALKNFRIAAGVEDGEYYGMVFQDSDVYKWLESVAYSLHNNPDEELERRADQVIHLIGQAQLDDGYVNTYYQVKIGIDHRWTNLRDDHELYCAGHMIEAGVAYYEVTGKEEFLDIAIKFADYITAIFGPNESQIQGYPGHQEIELALVRLYVVTKNKAYLDVATFFIEERGKTPLYFDLEAEKQGRDSKNWWHGTHDYSQAHVPIREQKEAKGHAVRALYYYSAVADIARLTNDESLKKTVEVLWRNIVDKKMSINGGVGASAWGESFAENYDLPNDTAYNETCASIALVFFARRMLELNPHGDYADVLENALYNGSLSGMDLAGERFLYVNPLEINGKNTHKRRDHSHVTPVRQKWFHCACCPPNLARLIGSIGDYFAQIINNQLYIHLYGHGDIQANWQGNELLINQTTNYPFSGAITMKVTTNKTIDCTIQLRIPKWSTHTKIKVNGTEIQHKVKSGYCAINRNWKNGDEIELLLDMTPARVFAHTNVTEDIGKVAITRGPLVYVAEEFDNGSNIGTLWDQATKIEEIENNELMTSAIFLKLAGKRLQSQSDDTYSYKKPTFENCELTLIPYFMWGNRKYGEMRVWLNYLNHE